MHVLKIVKTKIQKQKLWFLLCIPPLHFNFYVSFPFPSITFQKQNFVSNMMVTDINSPKSCSKNNRYSGKYKLCSFDSLTEDNLIEFS